jgi:hypothetical protein
MNNTIKTFFKNNVKSLSLQQTDIETKRYVATNLLKESVSNEWFEGKNVKSRADLIVIERKDNLFYQIRVSKMGIIENEIESVKVIKNFLIEGLGLEEDKIKKIEHIVKQANLTMGVLGSNKVPEVTVLDLEIEYTKESPIHLCNHLVKELKKTTGIVEDFDINLDKDMNVIRAFKRKLSDFEDWFCVENGVISDKTREYFDLQLMV